jgi:hypothetical protein
MTRPILTATIPIANNLARRSGGIVDLSAVCKMVHDLHYIAQ